MSATRVMHWSITLLLLVVIQLLPPLASAQRRGSDRGRGERSDRGRGERGSRGRSERGGWGGGSSRGGSSRGGRGGWGGGSSRGGRGGGGRERGGRGGFDPTSFLSRLDRNGDGTLDASEQEGPARFILDRMRDRIPNLPPAGRPISIQRLARDIRGGGREERSSSSSSAVEPLVPGFGIDELNEPPLGFGPEQEQFRVEKTPEDIREAENTLSRYDRDQDGVLDQDEVRRVRWRSGWEQHDRNGDGKLTRMELATRYAMQRIDEEGSSGSRRSSTGRSERGRSERGRSERGRSERGRSERGGGRSGRGGFAGFGGRGGSSGRGGGSSRIADFMFGRADQNQSGVLEKDEWGGIRGGGAEDADKNKDQKITKEEFSAWMSNRMSQGGGWGGRGRGGSSGDRGDRGSRSRSRGSRSESSSEKRSNTASSAPGSYRGMDTDERLSEFEDLPEWFGELDANRDGQVMMAEYYASWSEKKASDFQQFDLNDDGIVTPKEAIAAGQDGAVRGAGGSSRSRSRDGGTSRTSSSSGKSSSGSRSSRGRSSGSRADQYRKHAANWLQKFDTDKDGVLTKEEWSKDGFTYTTADADGDDKVTVNELAEAMAKK